MSLRRVLGLSAAVSTNLRRSLSTTASSQSHPPWTMIDCTSLVDESSPAPGACFRPLEPPRVSYISAPAHLLSPRVGCPWADVPWIKLPGLNPISGQLLRLPYINGSRKKICYTHMGLLTQPGGGDGGAQGPRFAVADIVNQREGVIDRFLPEMGRWDMVLGLPCQPTLSWEIEMNQETVAFGGRLWWVDLTCGAISMDPFSYRPEIRFVELPRGSTLTHILTKCKDASAEDRAVFMREVAKYRRVGVSEGRLRYAEASLHDPFLLSSYVLDDDGSSWTLEYEVELKQILADAGHQWKEKTRPPQIAVLDPLNANVMYMTVGEQQHVVAVDIYQEKVLGSSPLQNGYHSLVPCVLPPWLGSSQIPTAGKKGDMEAIDVLVCCGRHYKG
ncbi:unnamed protein product [Alopecurus aequalis]